MVIGCRLYWSNNWEKFKYFLADDLGGGVGDATFGSGHRQNKLDIAVGQCGSIVYGGSNNCNRVDRDINGGLAIVGGNAVTEVVASGGRGSREGRGGKLSI